MSRAYCAAIFIPIPIEAIVMAFYAPMLSIEVEYPFGIGALYRVTGESISHFTSFFASFFDNRVPLYSEDLADKGKVEVIVQRIGCPD